MNDQTVAHRLELIAEIHATPITLESRGALETKYGKGNVWTDAESRDVFEFIEFLSPYVLVIRKSDKVKGLLLYNGGWGEGEQRFYFDFQVAE